MVLDHLMKVVNNQISGEHSIDLWTGPMKTDADSPMVSFMLGFPAPSHPL
jgi:hypothetical protein